MYVLEMSKGNRFRRYTLYLLLKFPVPKVCNKTKVLLPQAYVTLTDVGYPV